jgi:uncharacterized protein
MGLHGTRENEVDNLLRNRKFVDLYRVVREAIRISEPSYSIKNLEHFYSKAREGNVQNAGASIVAYEKWKETRDESILKEITDYNEDDVRSTFQLRDWLEKLKAEAGITKHFDLSHVNAELTTETAERAEIRQSAQQERSELKAKLQSS